MRPLDSTSANTGRAVESRAAPTSGSICFVAPEIIVPLPFHLLRASIYYGPTRSMRGARGRPFETIGMFEDCSARGGQSGNPGRHDHAELGAADVLAENQAQMVPEVGLKAAGPVALAGLLPLGRLLHFGCGQVVERHVFPVTAAAPEAAGAQHARHRGKRRNVLLVVPLVELDFELRRNVHGVQQ